ncbi:phosphatidylinositol glycan anchor biosynthesis class U protein [Daktulosphaira vitifoliae]|uniref:phosphatidylinositol glycan anchor biosynthesis class U protein n=1 Tax=Daktulosphaira vitifoliae TaxID=58002 RepID=UPI0021AA7C3A|nr:phosphatidylinositol glycan anchor biosynthesis class U protein [Daktulosphaira vitifoliae]
MGKLLFFVYIIGILIRIYLSLNDFSTLIADRVEISTPLNSWKKVIEGVSLYNQNINPYDGDLFHETPLALIFFSFLTSKLSQFYISLIFIVCDLLTAFILYLTSKIFTKNLLKNQVEIKHTYMKQFSSLLIPDYFAEINPVYVCSVYLLNPYTVLSCVSKTTTVFNNLFLAIFLYAMVKRQRLLGSVSLVLASLSTFYTFGLVAPLMISCAPTENKKKTGSYIITFLVCLLISCALLYVCFIIMGEWMFLDSVYGFILNVRDLKPNIGLFWYFFTEMFEHFRALFVCAFQLNASILYVIPLSIRLRHDPLLLATSLLALTAVFKSYPSIGDVGFYLSLLPIHRHLFYFMQQAFIVSCFFVGCTVFAPTVWHLWIYSRSANANFYFGVTLAFATTQIFLITDLLFAYIKRDFAIKHGMKRVINGKEARLMLD